MGNRSGSSYGANKPRWTCRVLRSNIMPFARTALVLAALCLAHPFDGPLCAQTYVQVAELDPNSPMGSRITSTVTQNKLSGHTLFGRIGDKITYIWAPDNQASPTVYQFASDAAWNRVLFGRKDIYIHGFSQVDSATSLQGPAGIDYAAQTVQWLPVYIADRANERVVFATFDTAAKTLVPGGYTLPDPDMSGVTDVAYYPGYIGNGGEFYAVSVTGRVSWWTGGRKIWAYGSPGTANGQFAAPKGICVGHAGNVSGSAYTRDFYVADGGNHRIVWLQNASTSGPTWMGVMVLPNGGVPVGCTVDNFGNVTVADSLNSQLVKYAWNLVYLDSYGSYGVGASNDNTFAHPHAVDVPFGFKGGPIQGWAWFGDGRVITAEDWGAQSGAREHYLGIRSTIQAQPNFVSSTGHWDFTYYVTDHATHQGVTVIDANGNVVRSGLAPTGLEPPGYYAPDWDGRTNAGSFAANGYYRFQVRVISAYGCSGSSWCDQTLTTSNFLWSPVTVSGPSSITTAGTYTWTANPSYGTPPYTYQWQYRNVGSQTWNSLGTGQSQSRSITSATPSFDIQVTMSWGSGGGGWANMSVDNSIGGGGCGPCSPTCKC